MRPEQLSLWHVLPSLVQEQVPPELSARVRRAVAESDLEDPATLASVAGLLVEVAVALSCFTAVLERNARAAARVNAEPSETVH